MQWSERDELRLVELYNAGASFADMCVELRRTHASLRSRVYRFKRDGVVAGRYSPRGAAAGPRQRTLEQRRGVYVNHFTYTEAP